MAARPPWCDAGAATQRISGTSVFPETMGLPLSIPEQPGVVR
jgi:hypothetical protein